MNERAAHISETPLKPSGKNYTFFFLKINEKHRENQSPKSSTTFFINIFFFDFFPKGMTQEVQSALSPRAYAQKRQTQGL